MLLDAFRIGSCGQHMPQFRINFWHMRNHPNIFVQSSKFLCTCMCLYYAFVVLAEQKIDGAFDLRMTLRGSSSTMKARHIYEQLRWLSVAYSFSPILLPVCRVCESEGSCHMCMQEYCTTSPEQNKAMKSMMKQLIYEGVVSETEWPRLREKWFKDHFFAVIWSGIRKFMFNLLALFNLLACIPCQAVVAGGWMLPQDQQQDEQGPTFFLT